MNVKRALAALAARKTELLLDVVGLAGVAALVQGAREIYRPAGWLVAGAGLLAFAVFASTKGRGG